MVAQAGRYRFLKQIRLNWLLLAVLAALPALGILKAIDLYGVNVPFLDEWEYVDLIGHAAEGKVTFSELVRVHDEHRPFIPRLILLATLLPSHGNFRVLMFVTWLIVCGIAALVWKLARRTLLPSYAIPGFLIANLLIFSPVQWQNWLMGTQNLYFLPILCLFGVLFLALSSMRPTWKLAAMVAVAFAGTFSCGQGILIWIAALPILLLHPEFAPNGRRTRFAIAWMGFTILAVALYLYRFDENAVHPSHSYEVAGRQPATSTLKLLQENPLKVLGESLEFYPALLGSPFCRGLSTDSFRLAILLGWVQIGTLAILLSYLVCRRRDRALMSAASPWLGVVIFAMGTAGLVTFARVWRGGHQALTGRYTSFSIYLAIGLIFLTALLFATRKPSPNNASFSASWIPPFLGALLLGFQIPTWVHCLKLMDYWASARLQGRAALHMAAVFPKSQEINVLQPDSSYVLPRARILESLGMLKPLLAKSTDISELNASNRSLSRTNAEFADIERHRDGGWLAHGHAYLPGKRRRADMVFMTYHDKTNGHWIVADMTGLLVFPRHLQDSMRKDFEFTMVRGPSKAPDFAGWEFHVLPSSLPRGKVKLRAFAYDAARHRAFRIQPDFEVENR